MTAEKGGIEQPEGSAGAKETSCTLKGIRFIVKSRIPDISQEQEFSRGGSGRTLDYPLSLGLLWSPLQGAPLLDEARLQPVRGHKIITTQTETERRKSDGRR